MHVPSKKQLGMAVRKMKLNDCCHAVRCVDKSRDMIASGQMMAGNALRVAGLGSANAMYAAWPICLVDYTMY